MNENEHARYRKLLAAYRDLEDGEREEVERHVGECADCAALLESFEAMDRDLAALEDPQPGPLLRQRVRAATRRRRPWVDWGLLGTRAGQLAAAGLVILLSVGVWLVVQGRVQRGPQLWPGSEAYSESTAAPYPWPTLTPLTPSTPGPGVADLLADPPAPGEMVEVDAYYSGAIPGALLPGGPPPPPDQVVCPFNWAQALTDRPFLASLAVLNGYQGNPLPEDEPWLVAVTPKAGDPGRREMPGLPYHARLRGHLGEPALADCDDAARIFVVEKVVTVYEETAPWTFPARLPEDYSDWPPHHDPALGYSVPYPPGWQVERLDDRTVSLYPPEWPGFAVLVRVHEGETLYDQYDPSSAPPLLQGQSWGVFEQGWSFGEGTVSGSQPLAGWVVERGDGGSGGPPTERTVAAVFSAHGRTYELQVRYPLGFAARQDLLTAYSAIVEGLRLDVPAGPSPTPPVHQELGEGPFVKPQEALARLRESQGEGEDAELLASELVSEAEARRRGQACNTFIGHPEGVWLITVRGTFEGQTRTVLMYVDAVSGDGLCGEEIAPAEAGDFTIYLGSEPGGEVALSTADLISYNAESHEMALTAAAAARLGDLWVPTSGTPFVVCVGDEAIYRGAFFTPLSSQSYDGVVILTILPGTATARIELGYPGPYFYTGEDPRGDPRILQALERAGKLQRTAPAATVTPAPAPTSALDDLEANTRSFPSPDGAWTAEVTVGWPRQGAGGDHYYTQMKLSQTDGTLEWVPVDEWLPIGLGYTTPVPLHWSRDGQYLYYTNRPVPDGCALFVNGWDLQRVDLADGSVTEIMRQAGLWLEMSPQETHLAYMAYGERGLVIRDLEAGTERETTRLDSAEPYDAGHIVWSPDGRALALTLAIEPCPAGTYGDRGIFARSTSIVWVDAGTLEQRTLVREDERRFISVGWADAGTITLEDASGEPWRLDAATGELTAGG